MTLSIQRLNELLEARPYKFFEQVASTQDIALSWLQQGAASGAVVIADEQTSGRGRQDRIWHTPPGVALAVSMVLRLSATGVHQVMMLGALAIVDLLHELGAHDVSIKWPNDVRLNGRKVCGVLPEMIWQGSQLEGVVLGIGLNVRVDFMGTELEDTAISLEQALGRRLDRAEILAALMKHLDRWIEYLGTAHLFEAWSSYLDTLGQNVEIGGIQGVAESVDSDGSLNVRDGSGQIHRMVAGDVTQ